VSSVREASDVELVLVNNGSKLGAGYLKEEADVYIENPKNLGYVRAINDGIKYSSGQYIVAGNNDYFLEEGWEEALVDVLETVPDAGIACPHTKGSPTFNVPWVEEGTPGGWWMIKRSLQKRLGLLDEQFFNVFADFDYLWRMWDKTGKKVYATPKTTAQHFGEGTLTKFPQREHEHNQGQWLLLNKWKDFPHFLKYTGFSITEDEIGEWLDIHAKYSQSTDYTS